MKIETGKCDAVTLVTDNAARGREPDIQISPALDPYLNRDTPTSRRWQDHWSWMGYTLASGKRCPMRVAGLRCEFVRTDDCVCHRYRRVFDHAAMWHDRHGELVMTAEPYELWPEDVVGVIAELQELGLDLVISGTGRWAPDVIALHIFKPRKS
jgi:hypothetical protein